MYQQIARPNKTYYRQLLFSQVKTPAKCYLCLPSASADDVKQAFKAEAINQKTEIIAFESDPHTVRQTDTSLRKLTKNYSLTCGKIENWFSSHDYEIDLAYIDLCGQINPAILVWMQSVMWANNAKLAFTFSAAARSHGQTFYNLVLQPNFPLLREPFYWSGRPEKGSRTERMCEVLAYFIPNLKINITSIYHDTRAPMFFIGGYIGRASRISYPKSTTDTRTSREKFIDALQVLDNIEHHQQIGGLKIRWNHLLPYDKTVLRKQYRRELQSIGIL